MNPVVFVLLIGLMTVFSSFFGAFASGGSSLILLALLLLITDEPYIALLTVVKLSAAVLVFTSGVFHFKKNKLHLGILIMMSLLGILGTAIGTYLIQFQLDENFMKKFFAIILLSLAVYLIFAPQVGLNKNFKHHFTKKGGVLVGIFSFFLSILNAMTGGLGVVLNSFLVLVFGMSFIEASAYVMVSGIFSNVLQSAYLLTQVPINISIIAVVVIGSIVGSFVGTKFQYFKGNAWVKWAVTVLMLVLGIEMLL